MDLRREVRARARVVHRTLEALTDDEDADVLGVLAAAARWDGAATPLPLAAAARGVERLLRGLDGEERAVALVVQSALLLAKLAMRSAAAITDALLVAPLDAVTRALVAFGWDPTAADRQVSAWLEEARLDEAQTTRAGGADAR